MASFDYSRPKATAERLIARFGQPGKLLRYTKGGPAHNPTVTYTEHDCTFAVMAYSNREVDGTRVLATDKKVFLSTEGLSFEPSLMDRLMIGRVAHSIIRADPLAPGSVTVFWEIQCRR